MPRFAYRALRPAGGEITGELVAADERDAAQLLQALGSYPIEIAPPAGRVLRFRANQRRLPGRELELFTRQLATLLDAGIALDRALALIAGAHGRSTGWRLAGELLAAISRGESLSQACGADPGLPPHYAMVIAAGEARGNIAGALERLAEVLERGRAATRALLDTLIYPAGVLVVALVSIAFLLGFVVPRFETLLTSLQRDPPLAMQALLGLSRAYQILALPGLLVVVALIALIAVRWRAVSFRLAVHLQLLRLPWFGPFLGKLEAERLLYLLGNLVAAGVALPTALAATRAAVSSEAARAGLALTEQGITRGDAIADAFAAAGLLPEAAVELVRIGAETAELAPMLLKAAAMLRQEFEASSRALIGLVTPLSIVLLGLLIGSVAAAILGTVMEVYDLAG